MIGGAVRKRSAPRPGRKPRTRSRPTTGGRAARRNLAALNPGVSGAEQAPSLGELEREAGLRFIVRTRNQPQSETIRNRLREEHGLETEVEPLFQSLDAGRSGGIGRRYLVTVPGVGRRDVALNPYELGYRLGQTPKLEIDGVEPDLPHSMYAGNVATQAAAFGGILRCEVPADESLPLTWHL